MKNQENSSTNLVELSEVVICDLSKDEKTEVVFSQLPEPNAVQLALQLFSLTKHNIFVRSGDVDIVRLIHSVE